MKGRRRLSTSTGENIGYVSRLPAVPRPDSSVFMQRHAGGAFLRVGPLLDLIGPLTRFPLDVAARNPNSFGGFPTRRLKLTVSPGPTSQNQADEN